MQSMGSLHFYGLQFKRQVQLNFFYGLFFKPQHSSDFALVAAVIPADHHFSFCKGEG